MLKDASFDTTQNKFVAADPSKVQVEREREREGVRSNGLFWIRYSGRLARPQRTNRLRTDWEIDGLNMD